MKLKAPFKGRFKAQDPGTATVAGQLDFDIIKGVQLSTIGTFHKDPLSLRVEHRWKCVHGFATNGRYLTLLDCRGHESFSMPGFPEGKFWAARLLTGHKYFDASAPSIKSTAFRISYLDAWLNRSGVRFEIDQQDFSSFRAEHKHQGAIPIHQGDRLSVSIWHSTNTPIHQAYDVLNRFKEVAYINVKYTQLTTVEQATDDMLMLRDLFSLWISAPVAIEDANVFVDGEMSDPTRCFDLYFPLGYECPAGKDIRQHHMLFPFDDLETIIHDAIGQWVDLYPKIKRGISFYHEAYFSKNRHAFQKFIDYVFSYESVNRALHPMTELPEAEYASLRAQILEGVTSEQHRFMDRVLRYANESSLRKRMKESFKRIGLSTEFDNKAIKLHIDRMVNARNDIVHYAVVNSNETVSDENVVDYNTLLRILNVAELLLAIGLLNEGAVDRIKRDSQFAHFLGRRWNGL